MAARSQHAVGASLDPASMAQYINDWTTGQGNRLTAQTTLQDVLAADPVAKADILHDYLRGVGTHTANLAQRGMSAGGYSAGDLTDLERTRVINESAQAGKVAAAKAAFTATITNLNTAQRAQDANYARLAGQNIQAGTGRFKNEKPAGWVPPALQGQPTATPAPPAPKPAVTAGPKVPPVLGAPTGVRPGLKPGGYIQSVAKRINNPRLGGVGQRVRG